MFVFLMIFGGVLSIGGVINIFIDDNLPTSIIFLIMGISALTLGWVLNYYKEKRNILENGAKEIEEITKKYKKRYIEMEHSKESYRFYINLKDYPKSKNPNYRDFETYEAIILFIKRMYIISEKIHHGNPFKVEVIQLANLIMNETPEEYLKDEELFLSTLNAYTAYYFSVDETAIYNKLLNDIEDSALVSDIMFRLRKKYIDEYKKNANEAPLYIENIPDVADLMTDVFDEMNLLPPL